MFLLFTLLQFITQASCYSGTGYPSLVEWYCGVGARVRAWHHNALSAVGYDKARDVAYMDMLSPTGMITAVALCKRLCLEGLGWLATVYSLTSWSQLLCLYVHGKI